MGCQPRCPRGGCGGFRCISPSRCQEEGLERRNRELTGRLRVEERGGGSSRVFWIPAWAGNVGQKESDDAFRGITHVKACLLDDSRPPDKDSPPPLNPPLPPHVPAAPIPSPPHLPLLTPPTGDIRQDIVQKQLKPRLHISHAAAADDAGAE